MIGRSERLLQPPGAVSPDRQKPICESCALLAANTVEALANRIRYGSRDCFASTLGELSCETLHFFVFVAEHSWRPFPLRPNIPTWRNQPAQIGGAPGGLPPSAPYHASRPVSRVLYGAKQVRTLRVTAIPLEPPVARRLKQPTRAADPDIDPRISPRAAPIRSCSRWGLPCRRRCRRRGALLPHRFTLAAGFRPRRSTFSVALSLGSPPPDVIRHRMSMEPGLSSPATFRSVPGRPSGRLTD
jgi:hypothetical protein